MKYVTIVLIAITFLLQIRLWHGNGSVTQVRALRKAITVEQLKTNQLQERNQRLEAEVYDLKHRLGALEERSRTDLGMIQQGETFYQYGLE